MPVGFMPQRSVQVSGFDDLGRVNPLRRLYPLPVRQASVLPRASIKFASPGTPLPLANTDSPRHPIPLLQRLPKTLFNIASEPFVIFQLSVGRYASTFCSGGLAAATVANAWAVSWLDRYARMTRRLADAVIQSCTAFPHCT